MKALSLFKKPSLPATITPIDETPDLSQAIYLGKASPEFLSQLSSGVKAAYGAKTANLIKDSFVFNMRGHTGTLGTNADGTISFRILDENNKLIGQAGADRLTTQGITYGIMSLASFATGQYFMAQINNQLTEIKKGLVSVQSRVDTIAHRQLTDKFSELKSIYDELQKICQFPSYYTTDPVMRQNTLHQVKDYMVTACQLIGFFQTSLTYTKKHLSRNSPEQAYADMQEVMILHAAWKKALEVYALSIWLEQQLSPVHNEQYQESRIHDLELMNGSYLIESRGLYGSLGINVNRSIINYYKDVGILRLMFNCYTDYDTLMQNPKQLDRELQKSLAQDKKHLQGMINAMQVAENYRQGNLVCIKGDLYRLPETEPTAA